MTSGVEWSQQPEDLKLALLGVGFVAAYQGDYSVKGSDYSDERHNTTHNAFDNLDYDAWVGLMTESGRNPRILTIVTEDNKYKTYVRVSVPKEAVNKNLVNQIKNEEALYNQFKSSQAFEELEGEVKKYD